MMAADARELAAVLSCPVCRADVSESDGRFLCSEGHVFPTVAGVPRLLAGLEGSSRSISESFGSEWSHFRHDVDRSWGQTVEERLEKFRRHVGLGADDLSGKLALDAGCGNGTLSEAIASLGCDVVAADLSESVVAANAYFARRDGRVRFLQADLMRPPFRSRSFDVVYCAGVLHHTPDTRATFAKVADLVAPGGRLFVWLYWRVPGARTAVRMGVRRLVAPLPMPAKRVIAVALGSAKLARSRLTKSDDLNWREHVIAAYDFFSPRYRWEHNPEEVRAWFSDAGFVDVEQTEIERDGFGMLGHRPDADGRPV
jgi:2-polyprenyl-3-methyl-5-hydroxy-6-metoxy-1,4-benzoquinol methylase